MHAPMHAIDSISSFGHQFVHVCTVSEQRLLAARMHGGAPELALLAIEPSAIQLPPHSLTLRTHHQWA